MARSGPAGGVGNITVLQNQPNSEHATHLLYKLHSLVKPIMKAHGWYLPTLAEFFPSDAGLLGMNVNGGHKILIRLRPAADPNSFIDLETELIGTMLHELTHNVRGPHDDVFFAQLDKLWDEYDKLRASGYSGEGFLGSGSHLGTSHNLPPAEARALAIKKAIERERIAKILGKGGVVGGSRPLGDPRELRARAAERRAKAKTACGGHGEKEGELSQAQQDEVTKAEKDGKTITIDDSEEEELASIAATGGPPQPKRGEASSSKSAPATKKQKQIEVITLSSDDDEPVASSSKQPIANKKRPNTSAPFPTASAWSCPQCTFRNSSSSKLACEVCGIPRDPALVVASSSSLAGRLSTGGGSVDLGDAGWWCDRCGVTNEHLFWTCKGCGSVKTSSARG